MQWLMLQQSSPEDYVIATGKQYSVREFIRWSANALGIDIIFEGQGMDEIGIVRSVQGEFSKNLTVGQTIIRIDPRYFRPTEVETLLGDPTKAKNNLGWEPKISAESMCQEMVMEDLKAAKRTALLRENGLDVPVAFEN